MTPQRVLVVDDEPRLIRALERSLRTTHRIEGCAGGAEALALLAVDRGFVAIVSDLRMPGMDGAAFLAQARALAPEIPQIMLTGTIDIDRALPDRAGIFRCLEKPCPNDVLAATIVEAGGHVDG